MVDTYADGGPSTRYRDLVELALITNTQRPDAGAPRSALLSDYEARLLQIPVRIELPEESWVAGCAKGIESLPGILQATAIEALALVRHCLNPCCLTLRLAVHGTR